MPAVGIASWDARLVRIEAGLQNVDEFRVLGLDYARTQEPAQASASRADVPARREGIHPSALA